MTIGTYHRAALTDMLRAARVTHAAFRHGAPLSDAPAPFYLRRASERLNEARKIQQRLFDERVLQVAVGLGLTYEEADARLQQLRVATGRTDA